MGRLVLKGVGYGLAAPVGEARPHCGRFERNH